MRLPLLRCALMAAALSSVALVFCAFFPFEKSDFPEVWSQRSNAQPPSVEDAKGPSRDLDEDLVEYEAKVLPWMKRYCYECHDESSQEAGVRLDNLDPSLPDPLIPLWKGIRKHVSDESMPPKESRQPSDAERVSFLKWVDQAIHKARTRPVPKNGALRRLTVQQYDRSLKSLLGIESNLTDILPPDGVSKDGFTNQMDVLQMTPLQLDTFLEIARKAIDSAIVDPQSRPRVQAFRMEFGKDIHPNPSKESLILGANNHLLANQDFVVHELEESKPFPYDFWRMQKAFRFIEGYQGNDTVRGWKEFNGIHHAVFACMRGSEGYPIGRAYELFDTGLALRPAIPSPEIFGESSTYGPHANFKISLRELPDRGPFQVRVKASKVNDALLISPPSSTFSFAPIPGVSTKGDLSQGTEITIDDPGIYAVEVYTAGPTPIEQKPADTRFDDALVGKWTFDSKEEIGQIQGIGELQSDAFGQALVLSESAGGWVVPRNEKLEIGTGDFTVSAWIHPSRLAQSGIVCLGGYGYTHGWLLDMPDPRGILRLESANSNRQHNGTVQSPPGVVRKDCWQHVCAVVRRAPGLTELFVNGYLVATGAIEGADLSNPGASLHIGRIENGQHFQGKIDEVRIDARALAPSEILALVSQGSELTTPPSFEQPKSELTLELTHGDSPTMTLTAARQSPVFALMRLDAGVLRMSARFKDAIPVEKVVFRKLDKVISSESVDALPDSIEKQRVEWIEQFIKFENRSPKLGVHVGLRRDCGSTMSQVGNAAVVTQSKPQEYLFEGAIENFPSPDVEPNNVNYLAGIREIGVRHEFTDGRPTPRLLIHSIEFEGPYYTQWPPQSYRSIFLDRFQDETDSVYAMRILGEFASRAFRRPLTEVEFTKLRQFWARQHEATADLRSSIAETLCFILVSPQFLYISESSSSPDPEPIDSWELASKLSYFLWDSPPDEELLQLAKNDKLFENLDTQIDRMISDPKSYHFVETFVSQWLGLQKLDTVEVDRKKYPYLTKEAKQFLRLEPIETFYRLLKENRSIEELIASDEVIVNEPVAAYYGLGDRIESGFDFLPIKHEQQGLGGILGQAGIMIGLSDGREANPVKRGAWFARKMIDTPPEDPPPNVPKLEDLTQFSLREKLERHRNVPGCANCHAGIDPWGLPFEAFDASGRYHNGVQDTSSSLPAVDSLSSGVYVENFEAFRKHLLESRFDQIAQSVTKHLATYACGRRLTYNESSGLRDDIAHLKESRYRLGDLVRWVIHSKMFLEK